MPRGKYISLQIKTDFALAKLGTRAGPMWEEAVRTELQHRAAVAVTRYERGLRGEFAKKSRTATGRTEASLGAVLTVGTSQGGERLLTYGYVDGTDERAKSIEHGTRGVTPSIDEILTWMEAVNKDPALKDKRQAAFAIAKSIAAKQIAGKLILHDFFQGGQSEQIKQEIARRSGADALKIVLSNGRLQARTQSGQFAKVPAGIGVGTMGGTSVIASTGRFQDGPRAGQSFKRGPGGRFAG